MKKNRRFLLISFACIIALSIIFLFLYSNFSNKNKLNPQEKRFLATNISTVQNINILNDINIFGNDGTGLFYDFIDDFSKNYGINVNNVTYNLGETVSGVSFTAGNTLSANESLFYEDHYVLVAKKYEFLGDSSKVTNMKIGVMSDSLSYVSGFLNNNTLTGYDTKDNLLKDFEEQNTIKYMIVPLNLYLDIILSKDYSIIYHFSDIKYYYKVSDENKSVLSSILEKYYNIWSEKYFQEYYQSHLLNLFLEDLEISQTEIDTLQSVSYEYGLVNCSPYEILSNGNYGGIIAQFLRDFQEFSGIDINFVKYKKLKKYLTAANSGDLALYFNFYNTNNNLESIHTNVKIRYHVLVSMKNSLTINSINSLKNEEVYVLDNSILYNLLLSNTNLNLKTYKDINELKKLVKKDKIIIMDSIMYSSYSKNVLDKYSIRYQGSVNSDYVLKSSSSPTFNKLLQHYINIKDPNVLVNKGIYNHDLTFKTGNITSTIARYFMYLLIIFVITLLYIYKVTKKIKISKKIKKDDKLKYIDQLTSLKNRNYLSENMEAWDKNTIYPQAIIVADLNNLQEINDTVSYEQGDIQIKSAANILVKNQLDNSDVIRTDGNEFVIYLVGYTQKQITSYIHKLNREFKKLPYNRGASIGYSMITDDLKSIEDAINEAIEDIKKQKENIKKEED